MKLRSVFGLSAPLALAAFAAGAQAQDLTIATSVPHLGFPFFVHMENALKTEAGKLGGITLQTYDGQNQTPKQTADVEAMIVGGVDGIVISPLELGRDGAGGQAGGGRRHPGRHDRPAGRRGRGPPRPCRRRQRQGRRGAGRT